MIEFDNGVEIPLTIVHLAYIAVVLTTLAHSIRRYRASREDPRSGIPSWDWLIQIVMFVIGALIFGWMLLPPTMQ